VLAEVSLWLAGALNLVAFVVGAVMPRGAAWFPLVHAVSIVMEALFCTGCVVLVYQLCLRWFGREVLDGMMTASQVVVGVALTVGSQVVPQVIGRLEGIGRDEPLTAWWLGLLPPVWFAAFDEVATVGGSPGSWGLAGLAVVATATVLWLAVGKLSREYERGLQGLGEGSAQPQRTRSMRRSLEWLIDRPPLAWILRDSVARASFLLTARYLFRDRDVMLRMYPGLAPILVMPFVFMLGPARRSGAGLVLTSGFLGLIPMTGLSLMRYSQNFQAADVFRAAPLTGPARLCHGARWAMLTLLTVPMLVIFGAISWLFNRSWSEMVIFLPGLMLMPIFSLVPCLDGRAVPLSVPGEEAKAASRGARMFAIAIISSAIGGLGMLARWGGWLWQLLAVEALVVAVIYVFMRRRVEATQWPSLE